MRPARRRDPWLFLFPTLATLVVFFVYPLGLAFYRSFFEWDLLTEPRWVGLANYADLATTGELGGTLLRTLVYSGIVVAASLALGLLLAVALDRRGLVFSFVRGAIFSAYVVSWVAVALLWMWILDGEGGVVARSLRAIGVHAPAFLANPSWALPTLAFVTVWKVAGYSMVLFLTGLQDVPPAVLEAAALDGASPWRRFWHVTWPLLRPTAAFVGTTSLILSFQAFDVVRVMTQGGPVRSTTTFVYAIYEQVFRNLRVGRASALTVVFFLLLAGLTALQLWSWRLSARRRSA